MNRIYVPAEIMIKNIFLKTIHKSKSSQLTQNEMSLILATLLSSLLYYYFISER
jgi:hypothetical protein